MSKYRIGVDLHLPRWDASGATAGRKGGEPKMGEKNRCRVVIKRAGGGECTLPVESCCDEAGGEHVIVVRCDTDASDCCCADDK
jgi:hypothetical protein